MSDVKELQDDEKEALISIYEGDTAFKQSSDTVYQYKYGQDDDIKSFLLEITWGENYPNELPVFNMDMFYNRNLIPEVKSKIIEAVTEEGQQWIGCGMTYTLFECLKERQTELLAEQPDQPAALTDITTSLDKTSILEPKDKIKKEQLTKAQKRKQWERSDHNGEMPRGYDWVDVVRHLSQTGGKNET